jgi:hypothetical protein
MNCAGCGRGLEQGSRFCTECGTAVPDTLSQASGRGTGHFSPILMGVLASFALLAILTGTAVVGFTGGGDGGSGVRLPTAKEAARQLFTAIERRDVANLVSLTDPEVLEKLRNSDPGGYDARVSDYFFEEVPGDTTFSDLEYDIRVEGGAATVTLESGEGQYADPCGGTLKKDAKEMLPENYQLVKRSDGWYVSLPLEEQ